MLSQARLDRPYPRLGFSQRLACDLEGYFLIRPDEIGRGAAGAVTLFPPMFASVASLMMTASEEFCVSDSSRWTA